MRAADGNGSCDVECPCCGAALNVDDSDDFEGRARMEREEDHEMACPVCDGSMTVRVIWEPVYCGAEAVER